ncbi:MAG: 3-hydroxybutyryl-CoA dehydrogenase [Rhodobacterales bacterium 32-67-9]|nr:MAG: 3-hydroxybutyryl-CoA dehydrogenase [Rhodobacterales bacterium 32-67-9]
METVGVVGLGTMGLGIALVYAQAGHEVLAFDVTDTARQAAPGRLHAALQPRVDKGQMTEADRTENLSRIRIVEDLSALSPCALIVEAVIERLEVKQGLFRELETIAPGAVFATNTSSIPVGAIASTLAAPGRLIGLHFFNPAPAMKLVELIGHPKSDAVALELGRRLTEAAGKTVVASPDRPGFIVNRVARPFYGEALALLEVGRTPHEIDAAMRTAGYRMGPFSLIDLVGADINLAATRGLSDAMAGHPRYHVFAALATQVASGHLGRKTGRGFVFPDALPPPPPDAAGIATRIEVTLINEAAWLMSEGGVTEAGIDTAMKLGLNFPRGPFDCLAAQGRDAVVALLQDLEAGAPQYLKGRYTPAPSLRTP